MKKSLLALAVLGAFAGAATAQSSVTMYGRVDLSVGKNLGQQAKGMFNGSGSRLGMRGVEDLGGGLKGLFNIESRFDADTGSAQNVSGATDRRAPSGLNFNRFWGARSIVGVEGGFGQVTLGREYTTAFLQSQLIADPWGWDTVVVPINTGITGGGIATVRNDSALTYKISFAGVTIGAQVAERTDAIVSVPKRPINFAVNYGGGPLAASFGYEQTGVAAAATEKWMTGHVSYAFGPVRPGIFVGRGTRANNTDVEALMATVVVGLGAGELRASYGQRKNDPAGSGPGLGKTTDISGLGIGYHHSLSKRTTVYADFARNSKLSAQKTGYDVGLKHNF
jgi:predicted porin